MMKQVKIIAHAEGGAGGERTYLQDSNGRVYAERRTTPTGTVTQSISSMSRRQQRAAARNFMRQNGVVGF